VGRSDGKRSNGRPRLRWEDNMNIDLQEMDWIDLAQERNRW